MSSTGTSPTQSKPAPEGKPTPELALNLIIAELPKDEAKQHYFEPAPTDTSLKPVQCSRAWLVDNGSGWKILQKAGGAFPSLSMSGAGASLAMAVRIAVRPNSFPPPGLTFRDDGNCLMVTCRVRRGDDSKDLTRHSPIEVDGWETREFHKAFGLANKKEADGLIYWIMDMGSARLDKSSKATYAFKVTATAYLKDNKGQRHTVTYEHDPNVCVHP